MADNFAQTVKQQADIVRIVGEYVCPAEAGVQLAGGGAPGGTAAPVDGCA